MNRKLRTYYYGVLGGIGGLIGWQISNLIGLSFTGNIYLSDVILGALIGLSVGFLIGIAEGLFTLNWAKMLRAGLIGALLGLIAGAIGLPFGEMLFQLVGAGFVGRALGWGFFGLMIGLAEGVTGGAQMWKGAAGGFLGGLIGGLLLEAARSALGSPAFGKALGLILLGASVGALIALIIVLLSRAWLEVTSGKLRGTEFILDKFMKKSGPSVILGSDALKSDIVFPDPDIDPQHAMLTGTGSHFLIKDMSKGGTFLNNRKVEMTELADRQTLRLGNTEMIYHEKR
ncbi:MAG: FHA domain-containing protein [Anaerolineales bacterium]|nr:FHA domain-containing protein [Anaerolineales bacterium]